MISGDKRHGQGLFLEAQHQLRQPLNAISLLIGELRQGAQGRDLEQVVADMTHALNLSKAWLDSLADLEKAERGLLNLQRQNVPLQQVFSRLRDDFKSRFAEQGLGFRVAPTSAVAFTDPALLRHLLSLLLDNAAKFTRQGKVLLGCRCDGENLRVEVWDSGLGVSEDDQPQMFEPFFRLDNEVRPRERGLGLGLTIAKLLADLEGGELAAESRLGQGSRFSITLRRGGALSETADLAARVLSNPLENLEVLLLEEAEAPLLQELFTAWHARPRRIAAGDLKAALTGTAGLIVADSSAFAAAGGLALLGDNLAGALSPVILLTDQPAGGLKDVAPGINLLQRPIRAARLRALCHFALSQHDRQRS